MDSDFFKAFVHSLRSTCFQFLDFRDHVSVRGYLAVDVDGRNEEHFVLSEDISRGMNNDNNSFSIKVAKKIFPRPPYHESQNDDHSGTSRFRSRDAQLANIIMSRHKSFSPTLHKELKHTHNNGRRREVERKPRAYTFPVDRGDTCNLTFTMEPGSRRRRCHPKETETQRASKTDTVTSISPPTVAISSSRRSLPRKDDSEPIEIINRSSYVLKPERNDSRVSDNDSQQDKTFRKRKRPHESIKLSKTACPQKPTNSDIDSESSSSVNSRYDNCTFMFNQIKPKRNKRSSKHEVSNTTFWVQECALPTSTPSYHSVKSLDEYPNKPKGNEMGLLESYWDDDDDEEECSITSVLPHYLIDDADDMDALSPKIVVKGNLNTMEREMVESKQQNKSSLKDDDDIPQRYNDLSRLNTVMKNDDAGGINNLAGLQPSMDENESTLVDICGQNKFEIGDKLKDQDNPLDTGGVRSMPAETITDNRKINENKATSKSVETHQAQITRDKSLPDDYSDEKSEPTRSNRQRKITKLIECFKKGFEHHWGHQRQFQIPTMDTQDRMYPKKLQ